MIPMASKSSPSFLQAHQTPLLLRLVAQQALILNTRQGSILKDFFYNNIPKDKNEGRVS